MNIMSRNLPRLSARLRRYTPLMLCTVAILLFSCASISDSLPEDISAAELIRFAQEAYSENNFELAFFYYNTLLDRYSNIRNVVLIANYEIGFLHFKLREYPQARERFEFLLAEYQRNREGYPLWVHTLTRKVITRLPDGSGE